MPLGVNAISLAEKLRTPEDQILELRPPSLADNWSLTRPERWSIFQADGMSMVVFLQ